MSRRREVSINSRATSLIKDVKDYVEALLDHERRRQEAEEEKYLADISAAQSRTWVAAAAAVLLLVLAVFAGREALIANEQKAIADKQTPAALAAISKTSLSSNPAQRRTRRHGLE